MLKGKINNYTEITTELLTCLYAKSRNIQQSSPLRLRSTLRQRDQIGKAHHFDWIIERTGEITAGRIKWKKKYAWIQRQEEINTQGLPRMVSSSILKNNVVTITWPSHCLFARLNAWRENMVIWRASDPRSPNFGLFFLDNYLIIIVGGNIMVARGRFGELEK